MHKRRFGSETEYGLHVVGSGGETVSETQEYHFGEDNSLPNGYQKFDRFANQHIYGYLGEEHGIRVNHLLSSVQIEEQSYFIKHGLLSNGARLYMDQCIHLEWCTPEAVNPGELLIYELSADQLIYSMFQQFSEENLIEFFQINRRSSDFEGHSWGYHENISSNLEGMTDNDNFTDFLASYLAMRNVFAGAGGYVEGEYVVSPRATQTKLEQAIGSHNDTKPLIRKDYDNGANTIRYQFVSTEAANQPDIVYMRHSLNEVIALMYENAVDVRHLVLENPVLDNQVLTRDLEMKNKYKLKNGNHVTALRWLDNFITTAFNDEFVMAQCSDDAFKALEMLRERLILSEYGETVFEWQARKEMIDRRVPNQKDTERRVIYDLYWDTIGKGYAYKNRVEKIAEILGVSSRAVKAKAKQFEKSAGSDELAKRRGFLISNGIRVTNWDTYLYEGEERHI